MNSKWDYTQESWAGKLGGEKGVWLKICHSDLQDKTEMQCRIHSEWDSGLAAVSLCMVLSFCLNFTSISAFYHLEGLGNGFLYLSVLFPSWHLSNDFKAPA